MVGNTIQASESAIHACLTEPPALGIACGPGLDHILMAGTPVPGAADFALLDTNGAKVLVWRSCAIAADRTAMAIGADVQALIGLEFAEAYSCATMPLDVMIVRDHVNWMGFSPLMSSYGHQSGEVFVDMSQAYDERWAASLEARLIQEGVAVQSGLYIARVEAADAVEACGAENVSRAFGAGVAPEAILAAQAGIPYAALAVNKDISEENKRKAIESVLATAHPGE